MASCFRDTHRIWERPRASCRETVSDYDSGSGLLVENRSTKVNSYLVFGHSK